MCLLKWLANVGAVVVNLALGTWALSFEGEWKAISIVFLLPAFTGTALGCAPSGSRLACVASALVIILGVTKLVFATVCAVFASEAARGADTNPLAGLGHVVFTILAALGAVSAVSDLVIGCSAYCRWRRNRRFHHSLELTGFASEDL